MFGNLNFQKQKILNSSMINNEHVLKTDLKIKNTAMKGTIIHKSITDTIKLWMIKESTIAILNAPM